MPFEYHAGGEIWKADKVLFHGEPGEIEFVADDQSKDPATAWYLQEFGGGVMVAEPKRFGRVFLTDTKDTEDLVFVCRSEAKS